MISGVASGVGPETPVVSVLITAYSRTEFLPQAIESLLSERVPPRLYEVILVSNRPLDAFPALPESLPLKFIQMEGSAGQFLAVGIRNSRGELISFLDDDDMFRVGKLQSLSVWTNSKPKVDYFHNEQAVGIANHEPYFDDYARRIWRVKPLRREIDEPIVDSDRLLRIGRAFGLDRNLSSMTVRQSVAREIAGPLEGITAATDHCVYLLALDRARRFFATPAAMTFYRVHPKSSSMIDSSLLGKPEFNREAQGQIDSLSLIRGHIRSKRIRDWIDHLVATLRLRIQVFDPSEARPSRSAILGCLRESLRYRDGYGYAVVAAAGLTRLNREMAQRMFLDARRRTTAREVGPGTGGEA
jgi:hypothetical protein